MSGEVLSGRCLCGAVSFTATPKREMVACHCSMCRRWSAGPYLAVDCGASVAVPDPSQLGVYKSSEYGERCFCKSCGSSLFWRMQDGSNTAVSAFAFDDFAGFSLVKEIFIEEQPPTYAFANETTRMTREQFAAAYMAENKS